ncbi:hypothetical protein [Chryseobacterium oncorhynchi]|uniref:WG repeat-containing protein n=1 Tax=Chryseobacterium oncorhynchi TaxID=741074 RepID=A0A316X9Z3_9FLAO|nr:hypothetical protein [Chryseobacterium oncorhynchi]PWN67680.1 hypothetical protein C1638_003555 [Chryseobacterium oncorhynchi]
MEKKLLILSLLYFCFYCIGQEIKIPDNFSEHSIPKVESKEWFALIQSKDCYAVKKENNRLIIEKTSYYKEDSELETEDGKLIGENRGEWGGALYFQPKGDEKKTIKVKFGNVVDIFRYQNKIYFTEGSGIWGSLYELKKDFTYRKIETFGDALEALTVFNDIIYIVSHHGFYKVVNKEAITIFREQFWRNLYPNSVVVFDEENIFIGMRSGIVKLNLIKKTVNFYREKKL